jgi:hypothetical protein
MLTRVCLSFALLMATPVWAQVNVNDTEPVNPGTEPASPTTEPASPTNDSQMLTPPPVSGLAYPNAPTAETRSNYLRYGLTFSGAYSDNALGGSSPVSDESYSIWPTIALDETTSMLHSVLTYSPGFTFYQRTGGRDEADQNAAINVQYRLSPHLTLNARDSFQKSSSVFDQPDLASAGTVSGGAQGPNLSVIAPFAEVLNNTGNVDMSYQFAANGMVGASGTFTNLHYPNSAEVPGLSDSSSQGGSVFYTLRASRMHYFGATYQYQRLISSLSGGQSESQTHAVLFYYTLYATSSLSFSFFGGPQHSDTVQPPLPPLDIQPPPSRAWTPAAGASLSWQRSLTSLALSYSHVISGGGGLSGAVHMDSASASVRQQLTRNLNASIAGGYTQNDVLGSILSGSNDGHTISGTASLQRQFGEHLNLQLGYTRLHQTYGNVPVLSSTPNTNREFISVSYQFSRPLGR